MLQTIQETLCTYTVSWQKASAEERKLKSRDMGRGELSWKNSSGQRYVKVILHSRSTFTRHHSKKRDRYRAITNALHWILFAKIK